MSDFIDWFTGIFGQDKQSAYLESRLNPREDFRGVFTGVAGRKLPPVSASPTFEDSLELAWFASECTDEEWAEWCRRQDEALGVVKPRSFWPVVCGDGAAIDLGFMTGGRRG